jgi:hypothetical protein
MKSWDLNIFHITDFLKLVECGNFSAAAIANKIIAVVNADDSLQATMR